jgi:hypothetical protein
MTRTITDPPAARPAPDPIDVAAPREGAAAYWRDLGLPRARSERYRVEGELGRGGMGIVLSVWDDELRRGVAMKVVRTLDSDPDEHGGSELRLARFLEEARVTAQLDHPGIVPVHELGLDQEGRPYFTMRRVRGRTFEAVLDDVAQARNGWTPMRAFDVIIRVVEALSYAHAKGVVHRDIKPDNVIVGDFGEVYLMDWGIAKVTGREEARSGVQELRAAPRVAAATQTADGDVLGTPSYMSPEQAEGRHAELGQRADVYAVGALLYRLLAGHAPYRGSGLDTDAISVWRAVLAGPPPRLEQVAPHADPTLVALCECAMARDSEQRFANAAELADALRAYRERGIVSARRALAGWVGKVSWILRVACWLMPAVSAMVVALTIYVLVSGQMRLQITLPIAVELPSRDASPFLAVDWAKSVEVLARDTTVQVELAGVGSRWWSAAFTWLAVGAAWFVLRALRDLFAALRAGEPFVRENVRRLRQIASVLLTLGIVHTASGFAMASALGHQLQVDGVWRPLSADWSPAVFAAAFGVFLTAQVYQLGVELESQAARGRASG